MACQTSSRVLLYRCRYNLCRGKRRVSTTVSPNGWRNRSEAKQRSSKHWPKGLSHSIAIILEVSSHRPTKLLELNTHSVQKRGTITLRASIVSNLDPSSFLGQTYSFARNVLVSVVRQGRYAVIGQPIVAAPVLTRSYTRWTRKHSGHSHSQDCAAERCPEERGCEDPSRSNACPNKGPKWRA